MKEYVLSYYPHFKCRAGACKHTCCKGWGMYVDEESLKGYLAEVGPFSDALKKGIDQKRGRFRADKKTGRCAFLNECGLCEIILNLGEDALCQVCRDHPRFRSFFSDSVEMGLGFCCEGAAELILSQTEKIHPVLVGETEEPSGQPSFIEAQVKKFRGAALDTVQDRSVSIEGRINALLTLCNARLCRGDFDKIRKRFCRMERLDKGWGARLSALKNFAPIPTGEGLSLVCEQFLANSLYRHLSDAEDTLAVRARALACVMSWWIVLGIYQSESAKNSGEQEFALLCDTVRAFSAEVEYSGENLNRLYAFALKFIAV